MRKRLASVRMMAAAVLALLGIVLAARSMRAEDWPTRPVRILIPFTAGGTGEMLGRLAPENVPLAFGQQIVPANKTGARGLIAAAYAANAAPHGHTPVVFGGGGVLHSC